MSEEHVGFLEEEGGHKSSKRLGALTLIGGALAVALADAALIVLGVFRPGVLEHVNNILIGSAAVIGACGTAAWGQQRETT